MITQNPIIGRARKKIAGVYSRTLYGKNVLQTCPPPRKGKCTPNQIKAQNAFGTLSKLGYQISPSVLIQIYYQAPQGHSRRTELIQQLSKALTKENDQWTIDVAAIPQIGSNPIVTTEPIVLTPTNRSIRVAVATISKEPRAIIEKIPLVILICPETNQCISLLDYTQIEGSQIVMQNLSPTYMEKECYLYFLWKTNIGTQANPIEVYGRFEKNS